MMPWTVIVEKNIMIITIWLLYLQKKKTNLDSAGTNQILTENNDAVHRSDSLQQRRQLSVFDVVQPFFHQEMQNTINSQETSSENICNHNIVST